MSGMLRTYPVSPSPDQPASAAMSVESAGPLKAPSPVDATAIAQNSIGYPTVDVAIRAPDNLETGNLESEDARIERLGRQRPEAFPNAVAEISFCLSLSMAQIMVQYFIAGFHVILPTLVIQLETPAAGSVWPASAFTLVVVSMLLVFGRLADMYGGYSLYVAGFGWLTLWSVAAGFSRNVLIMDICRILQGLGPSAFLPSSMMLMGHIYRPGPRKNLVFSLYGVCAPLGFFVGIFFAGLADKYNRWAFYFWIGATLSCVTTVAAYLSIPSDFAKKRQQNVSMNWCGTLLFVIGLTSIVLAVTEKDWRNPYISLSYAIGWVLLGCAIYVEGWKADCPILPVDLFSVEYMKPVVLVLLLTYSSLGGILLYGIQYFQRCTGALSLQVVAWFSPWAIGGLVLAVVGSFLLHLVSGTGLLIFSGAAWLGAVLLMALIPQGGTSGAFIFPSVILATFGLDITFNVTNIFIITKIPAARQGLAGALINSIVYMGMALIWGLADMMQTETLPRGAHGSHWIILSFVIATASTALVITIFSIRIERAKSDMTIDEKVSRQKFMTTDLLVLRLDK